MLQTCPKCGAANSESAETCYVCDVPLPSAEDVCAPVSAPSSEPEWRLEVAHRLESYRARRRKTAEPDDSQTALPFLIDRGPAAPDRGRSPASASVRVPAEPRPARHPGIEIRVSQSSLDFTASEGPNLQARAALVPLARMDERARAGAVDGVFLVLSYVVFLALFGSLGGQFTLGKVETAVAAVTFLLFYAQYFSLFTIFNGLTPGMHLCGLRVVSFDGGDPTTAQLLWRSFGYLISAGTLFLGFVWSLWDEDHLSWHDRISQTYIARELQE